MNEIIVFTHNDCLLKENGIKHPERKERLDVIIQSLKNLNAKNFFFQKSSDCSE